ncbi:MAG: DUF1598 domain-containing protein, partial [Pirellulaceae bacterium]
MTSRMIRTRFIAMLSAVFVVTAGHIAQAQVVNFVPAGIEIDAEGVMRTRVYPDQTGDLTRQRYQAAQQTLSADLQTPSELRKISLNRLEAHIADLLANGEGLDDAVRNLAGLTQITHVFYYPETGDIVIAGPAEGFYQDLSGRMVGMRTGKAIMQLEDLLVALRAFAPEQPSTGVIGCSIDPTQEGLANFQAAVTEMYSQARSNQLIIAGNENAIMDTLRESLGKQVVTIQGVPANSHFGRVLVEADYRMKMIGIGLEEPPVNIPSWAEKVKPRQVSRNALQRWYFTPDYQRISVNPDETAMQLVGDGVKLIGADERVATDGTRSSGGGVDRASRNFTRTFTEKYGQLAERSPVFAELRNLMDMTIVAAFIKEMDYYGQAGWDMPLLQDESQLSVETWQTPTHVQPAINGIWKGNQFATPIGGGVSIQ